MQSTLEDGTHAEVIGPAGIGKSRVLRELRAAVESDGADAELVVASAPDLAVPFAPFAHLLDDGGLQAQDPTEHLVRLAAVLATRSAAGPFVLLVDDAHRLDPQSTELLHQAMVHQRTRVVVAARPDPGVDPRIRDAVRGSEGPIISLAALDTAACTALAADVLDGPCDQRVIAELERLSGGNPFVAIELLAAARTAGAVTRSRAGIWTLKDSLAVPPSVQDVILERLKPLDDDSRSFLDVLAVTDGVPLRALADALSAVRLELLEQLGLVTVERRGGRSDLRLVHDLYRETLLDGPVTRIDAARRAAVGVLDTRSHNDPELQLKAGRLALELDDIEPDRAEACARIALRMWEADLAIALARAAGDDPSAHILLAGAFGAAGRQQEAVDLFEQLEQHDDPAVASAATAEHAMFLLTHRGQPAAATELLGAGLERFGSPHDELLRCALSLTLFFSGRTLEAIDVAEPLLHRDQPFPPDAGPALASSWAITGNPDGVMQTWDRVWTTLETHRESEQGNYSFLGLNLVWCRMLALVQLGRLPESDDPIAGVPPGAWWPNRSSWVIRSAMPATQAYLRGRLTDAAERYDSVIDHLRSAPPAIFILNFAIIAGLQAQRGDLARAREALAHCDSAPEQMLAPFRWWIDDARAWITAVGGDVGGAVHSLRGLAERHEGEHFYVTASLHEVVRLGSPDVVVSQLRHAADRPGATWFDRVCCDHAIALGAGDPAGLLDVSSRFEAGGLDLYALETAARAANVGSELPGLAAIARERVDRLTQSCGPVATPAMELRPSILSDREIEVARLAARGWTNARIGVRLGTSTRTVGNQLQSVYQKLHINSREELQPLFPAALSLVESERDRGTDPHSEEAG